MENILDIFNRDAFGVVKMTEAINKVPANFSYLGGVEGLFKEEGSDTVAVAVEEREGRLSLIPNSKRGTQGNALPPTVRKVRPFTCFHKQINDEILADQVQGVRMFGSAVQFETVMEKVTEKLAEAAADLEITLEYMRVGAVKGQVLDADGSVITDLFTEFGQTKRSGTWNVASFSNGDIKKKCSELIRSTRKVLGNEPMRGIEILCGDDIFDAIETSEEVREAHKWRNNSDFLVQSHTYSYFDYAGVRFVNYQGYIGDSTFIGTKKAYLLPIGVRNLFSIIYAPADYIETVNKTGVKFYAKQDRMQMNKGIAMEYQTNPLVLCKRPAALYEITMP